MSKWIKQKETWLVERSGKWRSLTSVLCFATFHYECIAVFNNHKTWKRSWLTTISTLSCYVSNFLWKWDKKIVEAGKNKIRRLNFMIYGKMEAFGAIRYCKKTFSFFFLSYDSFCAFYSSKWLCSNCCVRWTRPKISQDDCLKRDKQRLEQFSLKFRIFSSPQFVWDWYVSAKFI